MNFYLCAGAPTLMAACWLFAAMRGRVWISGSDIFTQTDCKDTHTVTQLLQGRERISHHSWRVTPTGRRTNTPFCSDQVEVETELCLWEFTFLSDGIQKKLFFFYSEGTERNKHVNSLKQFGFCLDFFSQSEFSLVTCVDASSVTRQNTWTVAWILISLKS